jgi:hypothetical protein
MVTRLENPAWQRSGEKGGQSARRARGLVGLLRLLDDYLEGTAYRSVATHGFAICAPIALHSLNNGNDSVDYCQRIAVADADAQSTAVALLDLYNRHLGHVLQFLHRDFKIQSDICL